MTLHEILDKLLEYAPNESSAKKLHDALNAGQEYLKHYFTLHLELDSNIASHCLQHSLSDPENFNLQQECQKSHEERCSQCDALPKIFMAIQGLINLAKQNGLGDFESDEIQHDMDDAHEKVVNLKFHLMRAHIQNLQFDEWFHKRDTETVFVTIGESFFVKSTLLEANSYLHTFYLISFS